MSTFEMDDESKEYAFNLLKNIEFYNYKLYYGETISLPQNTTFEEAHNFKEVSTADICELLICALDDAFKREKKRLKKELICSCGKTYKEPYNKCYECLMKQRKSQSVCKCGKYFNKEGQNGAIYKMCYNCNMEQKR